MLRTTAIAKELAVIERKLQETTNQTLKDALKKKQARLKDELNDFKKSTPALAKQLLAQRAQIKQLSKMDFNDLIRRLSKKPEYSFLRTMSKSTIKTDIERPAKPVGWRFKGRGNYDKPTMTEIKKGKRNGTVYREVRPLRSDVSQPLRLETGGMIEIGDKVKASKEYGGKSGTVIDKKGSFLVVEYTNGQSDSYHESDLVKKMENGGNMKNSHMMEDGGVIGQEIVFDDSGEENTGVIKDIHETTGDYIVATDDGRTVLAQKDMDVISLGKMRTKSAEGKKRFGFFEDGGNIAKENNEMLHSQAKEAKHHIEELHDILTSKTKVEPWVVAKMTRAKTDLSDITHYLEGMPNKMTKGGKLTDGQQNKFDKVMREWKEGKLHSGSANGPIVTDQDQAIAIAYSEAYGTNKMLFGGMVNELSDSAIDRMEGLVPMSTLQELLDNAKFIIVDMDEEGFEKDEIMSFLAYKISQIGSGNMMQSSNNNANINTSGKPKILVDLYNELSKAKNLKSLKFGYDDEYGHFLNFENGLMSESEYHEGELESYTIFTDEDNERFVLEYDLSGSTNYLKSIEDVLYTTRANEQDLKFAKGGGVDNWVYWKIEKKVNGDDIVIYERTHASSPIIPKATEISKREYDENKMQTGGGIGSLAPNLLMELWYAVWERKTDKYDEIAKKLDKEGVSFTIQNKVSEDAQNTRSRKAIDTFEVQDRIKKIMGNTKMATGGLTKDKFKKGRFSEGGGVDDCTASYEMFVEFVESSNDEYVQDANIVLYLEMNGVVVSYKQGSKKVAIIVYNPRKEKLSSASVISSVMTMFPKEVQANIGNFLSKYSLKNKNLCSATLIKIVNHNGELVEEFEEFEHGGGVDGMSTVNEIARLSGLRAVAVAEWGDKNNINLTMILRDLKSKKIKGADLMTAIVGKPGNKYSKDMIAKYAKMSDGGKMSGWKHRMKC